MITMIVLKRINEELQTIISELEMELDQAEINVTTLQDLTAMLISLEYKMYLEINRLNMKGYD